MRDWPSGVVLVLDEPQLRVLVSNGKVMAQCKL